MFHFKELRSIHIEISTRCQASCPMCARNNHGGLENPNLIVKDMSLSEFKTIFNSEVLTQIKDVCMCGNFGDPIMNDDLIGMCQYIKDTSPDVNVHIHTNGGARSIEWWEDLKSALPTNHCVFFAIDGLEDTHHIYRIGTTYERVIRNAKAFITAGGEAEWVFIKFRHNQHQVEEVRQRSKDLGFKRFTIKNTNRFIGEQKFAVLDRQGQHIYDLEPPDDSQVAVIDVSMITKFRDQYRETEIDCYSKKHREIYVDVHGRASPCCFVAHAPYNMDESRPLVSDLKKQIRQQYFNLLEDLGGSAECDLTRRSVKDFLSDVRWHQVWDHYWGVDKLVVCAKTCGTFGKVKPKDQIIENVRYLD